MKKEVITRGVVTEIVEKEVGASIAHHFDLMKEWLEDKFKAIDERFRLHDEKMDRGFAEIHEELSHIKTNMDRNSFEILALQKEQKITKRDIKELKKNYA